MTKTAERQPLGRRVSASTCVCYSRGHLGAGTALAPRVGGREQNSEGTSPCLTPDYTHTWYSGHAKSLVSEYKEIYRQRGAVLGPSRPQPPGCLPTRRCL